MSFPIYEPIISVTITIEHDHYDALTETTRRVDGNCVAHTIQGLKDYFQKYKGIAGSLGYGPNTRPDLNSIIRLEWVDKSGTCRTEFDNAKKFIEFVKERPALAKALEFEV